MNKILIKLAVLFVFPLFVLVVSVGLVSAQNELLFGQNHSYSVLFRGNGEAITYAKIAITNPDEKPLTEFSFEIPNVSASEMVVYQMKLPQECANYNYNDSSQPCTEYREPNYTQQYYYDYTSNDKAEYQKVQFTKSGNIYSFTFPTPVSPYKSTAIIIAYAAKGYVVENMGLYTFNFETIKVSSRIQNIRVAVDVDGDLLLKGKQSSVNYKTTNSGANEFTAPQGVSSRQLDSIVSTIGSNGYLLKDTKNLAPNESFTVKGEYAKNWLRLYLNSILFVVATIVAIFTGVYFLSKFLKSRGVKSDHSDIPTDQQPPVQIAGNSMSVLSIVNISVGLLSVLLVVGLTYVLKFFGESNVFGSMIIEPVFGIVGLITIVLMYVLVLFGPAIIVASKHGWKSLVSVLVAEFLWFVIFLVLYLVLFQSGMNSNIFRSMPVAY